MTYDSFGNELSYIDENGLVSQTSYDPETGEQLGSGDTASSAASENSTGNLSNMKSMPEQAH